MVPSVRLSLLAAAFGFSLVSVLTLAHGTSSESLVCVSATRDWTRIGPTASLEAARAFLRARVMPECRDLRQSVEQRITRLEAAARPSNGRRGNVVPKAGPRPPAPSPPPRPQPPAGPRQGATAP